MAPRDTPVVAGDAEDAEGAEGLWVLQIRRQSWKPRDLEFVLRLESGADGVHGTATVDPVFVGRTTAALSDWEAAGDTVRFVLHSRMDDLVYRFDGRRDGGTLDGVVRWNDGTRDQTERFSGFRREVRRFDVDVERFPVEEDPREVGVDPVLLDRLVLGAETAYSDGLIVLCDGKLLAARTFGGADAPSAVGALTETLTTVVDGRDDLPRRLRPSDFAALGQALLDGGTWTGTPVVSDRWLEALLARIADPTRSTDGWTALSDPLDDARPLLGYGLLDPAGEALLVYPEARLVVVRTTSRRENDYDRPYQDRDRMIRAVQMATSIALEKLGREPIPR